jgi:glycerophosphoryl diester phosphodiesterase
MKNKNKFPSTGGLWLTLLATLVAMLSAHAQDSASPAVRLLECKRPLVIGHRGYSQFAPENTLPSFKLALEAGADMAELDYYHSKDGALVVIHDATLDRTTDATNRWGGKKISVESKTAAEIQSLDAGSWFDPKYAGTKIPLLTNVLEVVHAAGGVTLIERKGGDAATCVKMLEEKKLINQVIVQSFNWDYLKAFHDLNAAQVLGALGPPKTLADGSKPGDKDKALSAEWLDLLALTGAKAVVWNDQVSKESVALAHQRGFKVWVYTINDSEKASQLLDLGVDGLITNNTSLMWRTVALRKSHGAGSGVSSPE